MGKSLYSGTGPSKTRSTKGKKGRNVYSGGTGPNPARTVKSGGKTTYRGTGPTTKPTRVI